MLRGKRLGRKVGRGGGFRWTGRMSERRLLKLNWGCGGRVEGRELTASTKSSFFKDRRREIV